MRQYLFLRATRLVFWGAFLVALALATWFDRPEFRLADIIRYAPPTMLALALLAGLFERLVRKRNGLPAKRLYGA